MARIEAPKNPITSRKHFERYLTEAEEKKLFATLKKHASRTARRDMNVLILLRQTGLRIGSTLALNVDDAMEAVRTKRLVLRPDTMKFSQAHSVFLNVKACDALSALIKIRREQGFSNVPMDPLICGRSTCRGPKRLGIRSFQVRMQYWRELAGLEVPASPHWMRHTLAKRLIANSTAESPIAVAQIVLGHKSIQATAIYTVPDRESIARAMEEAS